MKKIISTLLILIFSITTIFAKTGTVLDDKVRIRSAPSLTYSVVVGVVNKGDELEVDAKTEELDYIDGFSKPWYRVTFKNKHYWIYGGYFSVDSDNKKLSEFSKASAMRDALFQYNVDFAINCGEYIKRGKNITKTYESFKTEGGFLTDAACYTFEYGSVIIYCYTTDGSYYTWTGTSIIKDDNNPLKIKFNMTMEEVKAIFIEFDSVKKNTAYLYGGGIRAELTFNNNKLKTITLIQDGC